MSLIIIIKATSKILNSNNNNINQNNILRSIGDDQIIDTNKPNSEIKNIMKNEVDNKEYIDVNHVYGNVINKNDYIINEIKKNISPKSWHQNCKSLCWWCDTNITDICIGLPIRFNKNIFVTKGHFCSFSCAYTYNLKINEENREKCENYLFLLHDKIGLNTKITRVPDRHHMKKWMGDLTEKQFKLIHNLNGIKFVTGLEFPLVIHNSHKSRIVRLLNDTDEEPIKNQIVLDELILDLKNFNDNKNAKYRVSRSTPLNKEIDQFNDFF